MPGGGDNQSLEVKKITVNIDSAVLATPVHKQFTALQCARGDNEQLELISIDYSARVIPVDGTHAVTMDVNFVDDSAADAETALVDDFNIKSTNADLVAKVSRNIWKGSQILDPGDCVNIVVTSTTPDTAGEGTSVSFTYRVVRHS